MQAYGNLHINRTVHIHTYIHACQPAALPACMHAYMHTCIRAYVHTRIYVYMHTCIHAYMHHACMLSCIHTYMHTNMLYCTRPYYTILYYTIRYYTLTYIHACIITCTHNPFHCLINPPAPNIKNDFWAFNFLYEGVFVWFQAWFSEIRGNSSLEFGISRQGPVSAKSMGSGIRGTC